MTTDRLKWEKSIIDKHFSKNTIIESKWDGEHYRMSIVLSQGKSYPFKYRRDEIIDRIPMLTRIDSIDYLLK